MKNKLVMYVVSPDGHLSDFNITEYNNMVRMMSEKELENHQVFVNEDEANDAVALILELNETNGLISGLDVIDLRAIKKLLTKALNGDLSLPSLVGSDTGWESV